MAYSIDIRPAALDFIKEQTPKHRRQIKDRINALRDEPRPPDAKRLGGSDGLWRVRTGDFRIVYSVKDEKLLIIVITVGNHKDVYDRLKRAGLID